MFQQKVLRFYISLREALSNSIFSKRSINMIKVLLCRFWQGLGPLPCCLSKFLLKRDFLDICLTTSFAVPNFENTSATRFICFSKIFKFCSTFPKFRKKFIIFFCFVDNIIWIGCINLSLLRKEYLSLSINVWTKSPKILHIPKRDFFNFLHSD